jgi:hypothetical protein
MVPRPDMMKTCRLHLLAREHGENPNDHDLTRKNFHPIFANAVAATSK